LVDGVRVCQWVGGCAWMGVDEWAAGSNRS